jgi:nicotinate-nucleotide pyrophosphorylase (carboxylating)
MNEFKQCMLRLVKQALDEDIGRGDITSLGSLEPNPVKGRILAKSDGILSGVVPALIVFEVVDSANRIHFVKHDGEQFHSGDLIAEIDGFNQTVLCAERTALNFLGRLSGIATLTGQFVAEIEAANPPRICRLLDTRKTTPGFRLMEKQAVLHGGGMNHRIGLYDMVLIKDNHIASAGSIAAAVQLTREYLDTPDFRIQFESHAEDIMIEVEVASERELREAIDCQVDRIMLDNQSTASLAAMVQIARELDDTIELEASGNVTLATIGEIARTGVDFISCGSITHSAPSSDFTLLVSERVD